jgi:hypothetical protein
MKEFEMTLVKSAYVVWTNVQSTKLFESASDAAIKLVS